jgi:pimeloyl-ACP methyl ester carboxylesterase
MQCGDLDGVPVLTFHPTPGCARWVRVHAAAALATGVRLVGFSRPGYGGSTPAFPPAASTVVEDAEAVAEHYGLGRFAVLGVSGGTPFAAATAAALAERVASLALCAPLAPPREVAESGEAWEPDELELHALAVSGDVEQAVVEMRHLAAREFGAMLERDDESLARGFRDGVPPPDRELFDHVHAMALAVVLRDALEDDDEQPCFEGYVFDSLATGTGELDLATATAPTRVWAGELDRITPLSHAQWYADRIPRAELTVVPGGHFAPFAGHAQEVLRSLAAGEGTQP